MSKDSQGCWEKRKREVKEKKKRERERERVIVLRIGSSWRNEINKKGVMIEDVITFLPDTETKKIPNKCILKQDRLKPVSRMAYGCVVWFEIAEWFR